MAVVDGILTAANYVVISVGDGVEVALEAVCISIDAVAGAFYFVGVATQQVAVALDTVS